MNIQKLIDDFEEAVRHTNYEWHMRPGYYLAARELLEKALKEGQKATEEYEFLKDHYEQRRLDI